MNGEKVPCTAPAPEFRADANALRFWVVLPGNIAVGALLPASVLHYRFQGRLDGTDAVAVYAKHQADIDEAVLRRVAAGSREPVMLRETDLPLAHRSR